MFLGVLATTHKLCVDAAGIDAEYDYSTLDPHHADGAPYGGFARATRQRLAQLPLLLKESSIGDDDDDDQQRHYSIRDASGQLYACRLYAENELDPESLNDSMFALPRLQQPATTDTDDDTVVVAAKEQKVSSSSSSTARVAPRTRVVQQSPARVSRKAQGSSSGTTTTTTLKGATAPTTSTIDDTAGGAQTAAADASPRVAATTSGGDDATATTATSTTTASSTAAPPSPEIDVTALLQSFQSQLARICGQIHKGYWSYEWCFEGDVTQFHLEHHKRLNTLTVEQSSSLGTFDRRIVHTKELEHMAPNEWMDDDSDSGQQGEIARIVDIHTHNGSPCSGNDNNNNNKDDNDAAARSSFIHYQCCSDRVLHKMKSMIHRDGSQIKTNAVAGILQVVEEPTCTYNMTVCTPLLCGSTAQSKAGSSSSSSTDDDDAEDDDSLTLEQTILQAAADLLPELLGTTTAAAIVDPDASILDILEKSLAHVRLQTNPNGGWWTYELNHQQSVQQYHEVAAILQGANGYSTTSNVRDSEHVLGLFDPTSTTGMTKATEWQYVVNVTTSTTDDSWGEGNGAYFPVEYTGGTVCDDADVTEHGMTAIERSSTVRYYCGELFDFDIREDTTCHYVVDVKVPGLCVHPLFRAPVVHQQVMKCLPVSDATELDLANANVPSRETIEI